MRELNPKQQQQVRNLIPRGMTLSAIAKTIHKNQVDTRNYIVKAGLLDAFEAQLNATEAINAALGEHLSPSKIAQQYNFDIDFVTRRINSIKANELGEIEHPDPQQLNKFKTWTDEEDVLLSYFFDVEKLNRHAVAAKLFRTPASVTTRLWERSVGHTRAKDRPVFDIDNERHRHIVDIYLTASSIQDNQADEQEQIIYESSLSNVLEQDNPTIIGEPDNSVQMVAVTTDLLAETIQKLTAQGLRCVLVG